MIELGHLVGVFSGHFFCVADPLLSSAAVFVELKRTGGKNVLACQEKKNKRKKTRSFGCRHDNSLMSQFPPASEPLEPVHLRKYVSKRKPEKLFKK